MPAPPLSADPLTGLPDRSATRSRLANGHPTGISTAVLHIDLVRFRTVNASLGSDAGDGLLMAPTIAVAKMLRRAGLRVALIAHGSDVRIPDVHTATTRWSPFTDTTWEAVPILQASATLNARTMNEYDGPTFVSTPDLLDFVPGARWCPVVVTPQRWASEHPVLEREVPVVVHAPSASRFKGSELIDPLLSELAAAGRIDYRRVTGVPPAQMPQIYGDADIVLDQFVLGSYGVAACEAMAAGRVVVGHVTDAVRARVRADSGVALPIVEADPDSIVAVIDGLLADRDAARAMAGAGVEFVGRLHDGAWSAKILGESFLTLP